MKFTKVFLTVLFAGLSLSLFAQKIERAKRYFEDKKFADAKTEIDNYLANPKYSSKSDGWYLKSKIYVSLANDSTQKGQADQLRQEAFDAVKKYAEIEAGETKPEKQYIQLKLEGHRPLVDLYSGYSNEAATFYNSGNYQDALAHFKKCLEVFDFMSAHEWTGSKLDTNTTLYAGISAEKAKDLEQAAFYYGKLAEHKVTGEGFVEIYKWLADHYKRQAEDDKEKGDEAKAKDAFEQSAKYLELGKEVYPDDPFWPEFDLELVREKGSTEDLFKKYEELITAHPDNHLYRFNYAVELYQDGYKPDSAKRPANSKELIEKAKVNMKKAIELKPDYPNAYMVLGQIYYNEGVDINTVMKAIRPQGGKKLTTEELKHKNDLRAAAMEKFDEALPYFQKVDELLGSQGHLKGEEKQVLKEAYDLTITIYEQKNDQEKAHAYTLKYNDVDKVH